MNYFDVLVGVVAATAVCGLVVVIWEIATKNPHSFEDIVTDVRDFAQKPVTASEAVRSAEATDTKPGGEPLAKRVAVDPRVAA